MRSYSSIDGRAGRDPKGIALNPDEQFYIRDRGRIQGPYSVEKLRSFATRGRFSRHHQVSVDGTNWVPASKYPELFPRPRFRPIVPKGRRDVGADHEHLVVDDDPGEGLPAADGNTISNAVTKAPSAQSADEELWYYTHDGQERGPVPFTSLQAMATRAELARDDFLWREGMAEWVPAHTEPELQFSNPGGAAQVRLESDAVQASIPPTAIVSILCSFLPLFGSIAAIILGHVALHQIRRGEPPRRGRGLAISGLVLGYGGMALSILAALIAVVWFVIMPNMD